MTLSHQKTKFMDFAFEQNEKQGKRAPVNILDLSRFNKIAIQARAQMAAVKEAVGLSIVHVGEILDKCLNECNAD